MYNEPVDDGESPWRVTDSTEHEFIQYTTSRNTIPWEK